MFFFPGAGCFGKRLNDWMRREWKFLPREENSLGRSLHRVPELNSRLRHAA
jgi:hypothetical protein